MNLKKNGKVFTSKSVGTGPSSYGKKNLPGRGLTEVQKHLLSVFIAWSYTWVRVRQHWNQNRHNTAIQHLSGHTSQTRVTTFNPTCLSIFF